MTWTFAKDGCCGDGGFTKKGAERLCGCRTLKVNSTVTFDRYEGLLPRRMDSSCAKCGKRYTLFPHSGRVTIKENQ